MLCKKVLEISCLLIIAIGGTAAVAGTSDSDVNASLVDFEKHGFGMSNVGNRTGVSVKAYANGETTHEINELACLSATTQKAALDYLSYPASGVWSSAKAETAFRAFENVCSIDEHKCAVSSLIEGLQQFGQGKHAEALTAFRTCTQVEPGFSLGWRLLSLVEKKSGDAPAAVKSWDYAEFLDRPQPITADEWLAGVTKGLESGWTHKFNSFPGSVYPYVKKQDEIIIVLEIQKGGEVSDAKVTQSSGNIIWDELALQICRDNSPVAAPPASLKVPVRAQFKFDMKVKAPQPVAPKP